MKPFSFFTRAVILLCFTANAFAEPVQHHGFLKATYIKSRSENFLQNQKQFWLPVHQYMVREGKKEAWLLYHVKYPRGSRATYDYVSFDVLNNWQQAEDTGLDEAAKAVHSRASIKKQRGLNEASGTIVWTQLFEMLGQANPNPAAPANYVVVNEMKVAGGARQRYLELELNYFMPFHSERVRQGVMNNWQLYRAAMPYGERYDSDYVTFNGFDTWEDIRKNNPPDIWKKVHGDIDFDKIHNETLGLRATVNNEVWELMAHTR